LKKRGKGIITIGLIYSIFIFFFRSLFLYFFRGTDIATAMFSSFWIALGGSIGLCLVFRSHWFQGQVEKYKKIAHPIDLNEKYFQLEDEIHEN